MRSAGDLFLGNAWFLIRDRTQRCNVVVRFQPPVAKNVAEVAWHKTQKLVWRKDGSLDFHVSVDGLREIQWWILAYADQAEGNRPPADFYADELIDEGGFLQSKCIAVVYTDAVMAASERTLVKDKLFYNAVYEDNARSQVRTRRDKHTRKMKAAKFFYGFIDKTPDYSKGSYDPASPPTDCANYFLRVGHDTEWLPIVYYLKPSAEDTVKDVRFYIYGQDGKPLVFGALDHVKGQTDAAGNFKTGDSLFTHWFATSDKRFTATYTDAIYQIEMYVLFVDGTAVFTPIGDVDPKMAGFQCHRRTLAVYDLVWRHRPVVHAGSASKDRPYDPRRVPEKDEPESERWGCKPN